MIIACDGRRARRRTFRDTDSGQLRGCGTARDRGWRLSSQVFVAKEGYDPDEERAEHGRWTAGRRRWYGWVAMANISARPSERMRP